MGDAARGVEAGDRCDGRGCEEYPMKTTKNTPNSPSPNGLNEPSGLNGRDARGRFVKGWRGGLGNPSAKRAVELRAAMLKAIPSERRLCVSVSVDTADDRSERRNVLAMLDCVKARHRLVPGKLVVDAGYASGKFLCLIEVRGITPHCALPKMKIKGQSASYRARKRMRRTV